MRINPYRCALVVLGILGLLSLGIAAGAAFEIFKTLLRLR